MSDAEEYPGLRHALRSDAAINLYCGGKWLCWHLFHVLFVAAAAVGLAIFGTLFVAYGVVRYVVVFAARRIGGGYREHVRPRVGGKGKAVESRVSAVRETSKRHSLLQYVFGYCPVEVKMDPRWFQRLQRPVATTAETVEDVLTPTGHVWVCSGCGNTWDWEPPTDCWCDDGTWERRRVDSDA